MKKLFIMATIFLLSACSTVFRSDVSTFHTAGVPLAKQFVISPMNPDKKDSIEYAQYAANIVYQLERYGYRPAREGETPELIVGFDVAQSDGREKLYNRPGSHNNFWWGYPSYSYWYWRAFYSPHHGYWGDPFHNEIRAKTVYPTELYVEIREATEQGDKLFEGRAITDAKNRALQKTIPLLAESLFKDFPGPDGETRHVTLSIDKDGNITGERIKKARVQRYQGPSKEQQQSGEATQSGL